MFCVWNWRILKRVKRKKNIICYFSQILIVQQKKFLAPLNLIIPHIIKILKNELKFAIFDCYPELKKIYNKINKTLSVNFSGTGSTFFAEFENYEEKQSFAKIQLKLHFLV